MPAIGIDPISGFYIRGLYGDKISPEKGVPKTVLNAVRKIQAKLPETRVRLESYAQYVREIAPGISRVYARWVYVWLDDKKVTIKQMEQKGIRREIDILKNFVKELRYAR